jgi:hypothetical protein
MKSGRRKGTRSRLKEPKAKGDKTPIQKPNETKPNHFEDGWMDGWMIHNEPWWAAVLLLVAKDRPLRSGRSCERTRNTRLVISKLSRQKKGSGKAGAWGKKKEAREAFFFFFSNKRNKIRGCQIPVVAGSFWRMHFQVFFLNGTVEKKRLSCMMPLRCWWDWEKKKKAEEN